MSCLDKMLLALEFTHKEVGEIMPTYKYTGDSQIRYKNQLIQENETFTTNEYLYMDTLELQTHTPLIPVVVSNGTRTLAENATHTITFNASMKVEFQLKVIAGAVEVRANHATATPVYVGESDVLNQTFSTNHVQNIIFTALENDTEFYWNVLRTGD